MQALVPTEVEGRRPSEKGEYGMVLSPQVRFKAVGISLPKQRGTLETHNMKYTLKSRPHDCFGGIFGGKDSKMDRLIGLHDRANE